MPQPSKPGTTGKGGGEPYTPEQYRTSEGFTGEQITLTRISPRRGSGTGRSTTRIPAGPEKASSKAARMFMSATSLASAGVPETRGYSSGSAAALTSSGRKPFSRSIVRSRPSGSEPWWGCRSAAWNFRRAIPGYPTAECGCEARANFGLVGSWCRPPVRCRRLPRAGSSGPRRRVRGPRAETSRARREAAGRVQRATRGCRDDYGLRRSMPACSSSPARGLEDFDPAPRGGEVRRAHGAGTRPACHQSASSSRRLRFFNTFS